MTLPDENREPESDDTSAIAGNSSPGATPPTRSLQTKRIRCPHCSGRTQVGVPPPEGRPRRVVTQCPHCRYDLVVSRGTSEQMLIRACLRWEITCPYCKKPAVARVPPAGALRRKELTPCTSCRKPLVVERREEGKLVLRAHRGIIEGTLF